MENWFWYLIVCTKFLLINGITNDDKVCFGTYQGTLETDEPSNMELHYNNLRDRYTNCTYVDGNLEIKWIQNDTYDLSFLQHIREVTGYVLISNVDVDELRLPKLEIIRGRQLFEYEYMNEHYGLFVIYTGLKAMSLPALKEIIHGSVGIIENNYLCHVHTINWDEIISDPDETSMIHKPYFEDDCESCDSTCENGCWGDAPDNCQQFSNISCSSQCLNGRCFGSTANECCHSFCVGGCTGPTQKHCFSCKNFNDDEECKQQCPAMHIYNSTNGLSEPNPDGKYAYGDICVRHCPELLLEDNGTCVHSCPPNKMAQNGVCVSCVGCLKTCQINQSVHFRTIDIFQGCNIIEGSVDILIQYLPKSVNVDVRKRDIFDLLDRSLSTVKEITGYLSIQGYDDRLKDLSFLRNLEVIGGKQLDPIMNASLLIMDSSLESLKLKSLKNIHSGAVVLLKNEDLCYVEDIDWYQIQNSQNPLNNIALNKNSTLCRHDNQVCSKECPSAGCWGFQIDQCLACRHYVYKRTCLDTCKSLEKIYQIDDKTCGDCHQQCKESCSGPNADDCDECANVKDGKLCKSECPVSKYVENGTCHQCDDECLECHNEGPDNCYNCKNFKIFRDIKPEQYSNTTLFNCTSVCPPEYKYEVYLENSERPYCSASPPESSYLNIIAFIFLSLIFVYLILMTYIYCPNTKATKRINQVLAETEDSEPQRPTNVGPNLTKLRIIREAEIRRGAILGMGAFGRVYKGVWTPENENVKIPVAIKVLIDMSGSESSKEFLDEAYIMCSVEHPNLLKLHAVCMTSQMMLITQLMPLGCLLDYVRNNKDKIGSKSLLNWSTQIARGMSYLEERRLVHRDLAARNVLVQTPLCVKITDFGLAKLLDYDSDTYQSSGGKMPIKWLALESIRHGIFTSHSDVWSFGITIWELLSYGSIPYENVAAKDVAYLIEDGQKLPQPDICSLDIYCILLSCWVFDADARPTFVELSETFAEKARDHSRYLVIPGDQFLQLPSYTAKDKKKLIRKLIPKSIENITKKDQIKTNGDDNYENIELLARNNRLKNNNQTMPVPSSGYMNVVEVLNQQPFASVHNPEYILTCNQPT